MSHSGQRETPNGDFELRQSSSDVPATEGPFNAPDLEGQATSKGWIRLSLQQQRDTRHMVAPRCTAIAASCIMFRADSLLATHADVIKTSEAGEEVAELCEKREAELMKLHQLVLGTSQILALDQPEKHFWRDLLPTIRAALSDDGAKFLDEPSNDWVSVSQPDRLAQLISLIPTTRLGRLVFRPFLAETEKIGNNTVYHYHERAIGFAFFTVFSAIIGTFACAPAAIQSLNVNSAVGEVAVYLVFVVVFGWINQGLIRGFEKLLIVCIAYSGLMANLLRGNW
ncbi:hypothetical protein NW762_002366 [Fusarium torreyae]|uniref:Uncharacterized protein n=1 Tax=Fusarium torreyae TaxID=1237075 RepID=A0A9W8SB49_9HYPO|nr:hypothetical protein NW762_002366 [Fusarium torreyae]